MNLFPASNGFFEVNHTADVSVAVTGESIESLFFQSLKALEHILCVHINELIKRQVTMTLEANSTETLLVAFLNESLVLTEKETWLVVDQLRICNGQLEYSYDLHQCSKHGNEVKAVTYNMLEIIEHQGFYSTIIVFDV
jgi:SHS2 domain-containing protein